MYPASNNEESSGKKFVLINLFVLALVFIPVIFYAYSEISAKNRPFIEASLQVDPKEIKVVDEKNGLRGNNYAKISLEIRNNSKLDQKGLKLHIPVTIFSIAGPEDSGFTARKVGFDTEGLRRSGNKYVVLILPDINRRSTYTIELVSFYSKVKGDVAIQGEVRTSHGATYIAKPVTVVIN